MEVAVRFKVPPGETGEFEFAVTDDGQDIDTLVQLETFEHPLTIAVTQ